MINNLIPKNQFVRNVITLMTGTSIAQAIPIAVSPILTRIYSPDEFGLFALYMAIASILGVVVTGRYELAIMLPEDDEDAIQIVGLSSIISILISFIILLIIILFGRDVSVLLGNENLYSWLFFIPISLVLTGLYQSLNYWYNRKKNFKRLAKNRIIQSSSTGVSQISLNYLNINGLGLVYGVILGQLMTTYSLSRYFFNEFPNFFKVLSMKKAKTLAKRFSSFPKYDVPTSLLNASSIYAPNILFTSVFGPSYAGFFYLTQRVLQAPVTLISTSVLDVFKEEASRSYRETGQAKLIFIKTFKWLLLISLIPSVVFFFTIKGVFVNFFGDEWIIAGEYGQILLPSLMIRFIANPLSFMIYIAEKQKINLFLMIILFVSVIVTFLIDLDHFQVVKAISFIYFIYYLLHLIIAAKLAKTF